MDDFNREALHIEVDTSITSFRLLVIRVFEQLKRDHGLPQILGATTDPEFLGEVRSGPRTTAWPSSTSSAGKPNQNALHRALQPDRSREEILDPYLFLKIDDLRQAAYWWMIEYNERRSHDLLGGKTPSEFRQQYQRFPSLYDCSRF